jgi:antitoxin component YwqK of YwqJK toxin-antitoxin module
LFNTVSVLQGKREGAFKQFYPDGHLKIQGQYKNDHREGVFRTYKPEGWLWVEESFAGDVMRKRRAYDARGHLVMAQFFYK